MFLSSPSPGQILRYLQRNHPHTEFSSQLLLSDPTGDDSVRCLFISTNEQGVANTSALNWLQSLGAALSDVFPPRVPLLWRHASTSLEPGTWGFTVWEDGAVVETAEHIFPLVSKPGLLSRLPGMKRNAPLSPDVAWALARGLPIDRVPAAGLRRQIPIIDYVTVSQLDQRSLLVENSPRLYRFPL